jgi:hypothetical protein
MDFIHRREINYRNQARQLPVHDDPNQPSSPTIGIFWLNATISLP